MAANHPRRPRPIPHSIRAAWVLLLAVPFAAAACVTVTQSDASAEPGASAAPSEPAVMASPTFAPLASPTARPTPQPTPEPIDAQVFGFLPYWLLEDAAIDIDTDSLTTVTWHGIEASGAGRLVSKKPNGDVPPGWAGLEGDGFAQLKKTLQDAGVDVVVSIQRFGWTEGGLKRTENLLGSRRSRRQLADRIAKLVVDRGLDGANLDFEPMPEALADEYVAFVRDVRSALDEVEEGLHLSVDVHSSLSGYDLAGLTADDAADVAIIMAYDYRGQGAGIASSLAPLSDPATSDISTSVEAALEQVSPDKIILGLPWYGRAWSTQSDKARSATLTGPNIDSGTTLPYAVAVEQAQLFGRRYQPDQASAWTTYPSQSCASCRDAWRQIWYDDPDSFGAKIDYALGQGLAGVGMWALGHEAGRPELWWTLRNRLQSRQDDAPPNGNASLDPTEVRQDREGLPLVTGSAPLRLFASDSEDGSGLGYVRIGLEPGVNGAGRLSTGRTYPATDRIRFPLGDPATGGSAEEGPRAIHVQWRDLAGNWSDSVVVDVWVVDPDGAPTIEDPV